MMDVLPFLLLLAAYLTGSVPTAVWVSKYVYGSDVRTHGSGNAGSTNMFRTYGFKAGMLTQVVDVLKGVWAALMPRLFLPHDGTLLTEGVFAGMELRLLCLLFGLVAVVGHIWPVLAGFKGGKGINTLLGMMLVTDWQAALICLGIFMIVLLLSAYVSLSSMVGTSCFPVWIAVSSLMAGKPLNLTLLLLGVGMAALVIYTHRTNVQRLRAGTESQVGFLRKKKG